MLLLFEFSSFLFFECAPRWSCLDGVSPITLSEMSPLGQQDDPLTQHHCLTPSSNGLTCGRWQGERKPAEGVHRGGRHYLPNSAVIVCLP